MDKAAKRWSDRSTPLYVVHTHCPEEAEELAERARKELKTHNVEIHEVGPVIEPTPVPGCWRCCLWPIPNRFNAKKTSSFSSIEGVFFLSVGEESR